MIHRTIAVALLAGLASPVLANTTPTGPAYDQAAGLAAGRSADAVYDGGAARTPVQVQVDGALQTGGLAVERPPETVPPSARPALTDATAVPEPSHAAGGGKFFSKTSLLYGAGGAAAGAGIGWLFGGLLGAAIGAAAGFLIGFALSKLLKKH
ncbi:MAG TPA: hypothetical protein VN915_07245 [Elusimicrobiota bacterium]|nr:hypothetical protein [Elusimicrobiota bacterium]